MGAKINAVQKEIGQKKKARLRQVQRDNEWNVDDG